MVLSAGENEIVQSLEIKLSPSSVLQTRGQFQGMQNVTQFMYARNLYPIARAVPLQAMQRQVCEMAAEPAAQVTAKPDGAISLTHRHTRNSGVTMSTCTDQEMVSKKI